MNVFSRHIVSSCPPFLTAHCLTNSRCKVLAAVVFGAKMPERAAALTKGGSGERSRGQTGVKTREEQETRDLYNRMIHCSSSALPSCRRCWR